MKDAEEEDETEGVRGGEDDDDIVCKTGIVYK